MDKEFNKGDLVLLWDKRSEKPDNHKKFQILWLGPYQFTRKAGKNSFILKNMEGEELPLPVNGRHIKHFFPTPPE